MSFENLIQRYSEGVKENQRLVKQLQSVARSIEKLDIEQPNECLFGRGVCGYPIDDCYNCPTHEWSAYYCPLKCEFK